MATTEELLKQNKETGTPVSGNSMGGYTTARTDAINQMYDAQNAQREAELKSAYDQSVSAHQAATEKIAPQYQTSANDLATQYERNRRNFNQQAAGSGINTGAASQAALAQNNEYLRAFGGLRSAEADAQAAAARQMADLETQYRNSMAAALAENNYNRAGALLDEYNNREQMDLQRAQVLAQYGDFSGFGAIPGYTQDQVDQMALLWAAQNPDFAYASGRITADQYKVMTGKDPVSWGVTGGLGINDLVDGKFPEGAVIGSLGVGGGTVGGEAGLYRGTRGPTGRVDSAGNIVGAYAGSGIYSTENAPLW